jgi:hypothetical protein
VKRKTSETKISISDLKSEGSDVIRDLSRLLKEKTNAEVETTTQELIVKTQEKPVSRTYLRVLLRKFLHQQGLKDYFRVIGGKENTLIIKEIKIAEEEE